MLIRDRIKTFSLLILILLPLVWALTAGFRAGLEKAEFVFVNQGEVSSLDPAQATGIPEGRVLMAVSEGLVSLHPRTLEPIPACAESWEQSHCGRKIVFHLRAGLQWSNGEPLIANDFLQSWERLLDPATASPYAYLLWNVEGGKGRTQGEDPLAPIGLAAPDPLTFEVTLGKVCPYFVLLTAFYPLFPVHRSTMEKEMGLNPEKIIGNGPFRVQVRLLKDRIRLQKNPFYWDREAVALETVDALAVTSPITALNLYLTGEVDWINKVPSVVLPYVRDRQDFSLSANLGTNFLRFNTTLPVLRDPRVRNAISLALDKESLTRYLLKGGQIPATSFVPPGIPGYAPPRQTLFAPDKARALLAEAGYANGQGFPELNLLYSADETNRDIAEVLVLQLKKNLGIRIHPAAQERKGYFLSQNTLAYHLCLCSWLGDYLDPSTFLDVFRSQGGNNRTGWQEPQYDRLLDQAAGELNPELRGALLSRAEALLLAQAPLAPLYFRSTSNMIKTSWDGYYDNIQDIHPLKYIRLKSP